MKFTIMTLLAATSGFVSAVDINCTGNFANRCGSEWIDNRTTNARQLQDLVRESTGRQPTEAQARSMVFACVAVPNTDPSRFRLQFSRACAEGQCVRPSDGLSTCAAGGDVNWP